MYYTALKGGKPLRRSNQLGMYINLNYHFCGCALTRTPTQFQGWESQRPQTGLKYLKSLTEDVIDVFLQRLLLNFTPVGPTWITTKEWATQTWTFISHMRSHDGHMMSSTSMAFCWSWAFRWPHSNPQRKTLSQFSMKRCKIFVTNLSFKYKI